MTAAAAAAAAKQLPPSEEPLADRSSSTGRTTSSPTRPRRGPAAAAEAPTWPPPMIPGHHYCRSSSSTFRAPFSPWAPRPGWWRSRPAWTPTVSSSWPAGTFRHSGSTPRRRSPGEEKKMKYCLVFFWNRWFLLIAQRWMLWGGTGQVIVWGDNINNQFWY